MTSFRKFPAVVLLLTCIECFCQSGPPAIDIASIRFSDSIASRVALAASSGKRLIDPRQIAQLQFDPHIVARTYPHVTDSLVEKTNYLLFTLNNSADTAKSVYFLPGKYCRNIDLYKAETDDVSGTLHRMADRQVNSRRYGGCKIIRLQAGEKATFIASFDFIRTNINNLAPRLIERDYLDQWLWMNKRRELGLDIITYVATGILLLMIIYSMAVYLQNRNREFIFYSLYAFFTAFLLFSKSFLSHRHSAFMFFYEEYLDFIVLGTGVFFYLIFVSRFLNTRQQHPFLDKLLRVSALILLAMLVIFSAFYFLTDRYIVLNILENYVTKIFLFAIGITFIIQSIRKKDPLLNYLAAGSAALIFFSIVSLGVLLFRWQIDPSSRQSILNRSMLYYEVGLVLELAFFLAGLAYKNRRTLIEQVKERERYKLENERREFEKQMAVMAAQQQERDRISADMHDELGSGVTAIRLMSEIVKSKLKTQQFPELEKISNSANDLLGKMNAIIWTMKSSNDTLESLVAYIRAYAVEFFENTPISCVVNFEPVPEKIVSGEKRRNVFLCVKEALNNILKHSQASRVDVSFSASDTSLIIRIVDNGVGFQMDQLRQFGNGITNMRQRMESINGVMEIECKDGTSMNFVVPV